MVTAIIAVYAHYLWRVGGGSVPVMLLLLSMATIKAFGLQAVFYVDQITERLLCIERLLLLLRTDACAPDRYERCGRVLELTKRAYNQVWLAGDALAGHMGAAWLVISIETLEEVVVNVYLISSALFTGAVPMRAITLSVYGVVPTMMTFALFCWSCDRSVQRVTHANIII